MKRRGRPPHPGPLTRREQEVLELVRKGLSNAQIADSLEIARETVKWHVSEILSKLGVETREAAAAWPTREPAGEGWFKRLTGGALLLKIAGGAVIAGAVTGTAALGWAVLTTDGDGGGESVAEASSQHEGEPQKVIARSTPTPRIQQAGNIQPTPGSTTTPGAGETSVPDLTASVTPTPPFFPSPPFSPFITPGPTPPPPTPTPTPSPPPSIRCFEDWDCDGWSDAIEVSYGGDPYIVTSQWYPINVTPEHSDFDATYSLSTCSNDYDDDGDGWVDGGDPGCGGVTPTPFIPEVPTPSPRCGVAGNWDWDCDGWTDAIELKYGSYIYDNGLSQPQSRNTPEDAHFDATYGQNSCTDGIDNDLDGWKNAIDSGCDNP